MASAETTKDHDTIRKWAEARGGRPAQVGLLRFDFGEKEERLEEISWDEFFKKFDESNIQFLYAPDRDSRFFKFVQQ